MTLSWFCMEVLYLQTRPNHLYRAEKIGRPLPCDAARSTDAEPRGKVEIRTIHSTIHSIISHHITSPLQEKQPAPPSEEAGHLETHPSPYHCSRNPPRRHQQPPKTANRYSSPPYALTMDNQVPNDLPPISPSDERRTPARKPLRSSNPKTQYLILYNFVCAVLWTVVLGRVLLLVPLVGFGRVYAGVGHFTKWTQTLALLEVVHSAVGTFLHPLCVPNLRVLP